MKALTTSRKSTRPTPPALRREKSALRPIDEKKISMNESCSPLSKANDTPVLTCRM